MDTCRARKACAHLYREVRMARQRPARARHEPLGREGGAGRVERRRDRPGYTRARSRRSRERERDRIALSPGLPGRQQKSPAGRQQ
eukprot:2976475-Prymnesium_polylepis.1